MPARVVLSPFTAICPARIRARALARLGARPRCQTSTSRRSRAAMLDVAGDDVGRDVSEAFRARAKIGECRNALLHELRGALTRGFNPKERRVCHFFEYSITSNLFTDSDGSPSTSASRQQFETPSRRCGHNVRGPALVRECRRRGDRPQSLRPSATPRFYGDECTPAPRRTCFPSDTMSIT